MSGATSMENTASVVEKAKLVGDTPSAVCDRFFVLVNDLFAFLEELNDYIGSETLKSPPVPGVMITIVKNLIKTVPSDGKVKAIEIFFNRANPHIDKILSKNVDHFISIAPDLFPEIPQSILNQIVCIVKSPVIPRASVDDTFDFVVSMLRISTKYMCITEKCDSVITDALIKAIDATTCASPPTISS